MRPAYPLPRGRTYTPPAPLLITYQQPRPGPAGRAFRGAAPGTPPRQASRGSPRERAGSCGARRPPRSQASARGAGAGTRRARARPPGRRGAGARTGCAAWRYKPRPRPAKNLRPPPGPLWPEPVTDRGRDRTACRLASQIRISVSSQKPSWRCVGTRGRPVQDSGGAISAFRPRTRLPARFRARIAHARNARAWGRAYISPTQAGIEQHRYKKTYSFLIIMFL